MKIVCPSCEAHYEVPEVVLTSRRKMRCARCGTQWVPADITAAAPGLSEATVVPATGLPSDLNASQDVPTELVSSGPPLAATHDAEPDFILVNPEPAVRLDNPAAVPDSVEPAPGRPVALRPDTPVAVLPGLSSLTLNSQPRMGLPSAKPKGGTPLLAWGGSIAVLVVALAAVVIFRAQVMKAWPPSTRLYTALGLGER